MLTCAGLLLDLGRRLVHAHPGCIHDVAIATTSPPLPPAGMGQGEGQAPTTSTSPTVATTRPPLPPAGEGGGEGPTAPIAATFSFRETP